jgi:hypothetical protein
MVSCASLQLPVPLICAYLATVDLLRPAVCHAPFNHILRRRLFFLSLPFYPRLWIRIQDVSSGGGAHHDYARASMSLGFTQ